MRLQQYINESYETSFSDIMLMLFDKCYPFIKEISKTDGLLFSGRKNKSQEYFIGNVRNNRKPTDTPIKIHNMIDNLFEKKFGWKARSNSIFCTGDFNIADDYTKNGSVYCIFPIGKYKYLWNPEIVDLFSDIIDSGDLQPEDVEEIKEFYSTKVFNLARKMYNEDGSSGNQIEDYIDDAAQEIVKTNKEQNINLLYNTINDYKNTDLKEAVMTGNEIMLNCKQYIAVKGIKYSGSIHRYFVKYGSKKPTKQMLDEFNI